MQEKALRAADYLSVLSLSVLSLSRRTAREEAFGSPLWLRVSQGESPGQGTEDQGQL